MPWTPYISDSFTGADSSAIHGRSPDGVNVPGVTWSDPNHNLRILQNRAGYLAAGYSQGWFNLALATYRITIHGVMTNNEKNCAILFRSDSTTTNAWYFALTPSITGVLSKAELIRRVANVQTVMGTLSNGFVLGSTYEMVLTVDGDHITATVDGRTIDVTDSGGSTRTHLGIWVPTNVYYIDDFLLEVPVADSIAITTPAAASSHVRTVSITGTTEGAPTSIEASIGGQPYQVIDAAPAANAFAGTYEYTHPIVGTLTVRWGNNHAITATQLNVTVTSNAGVPAGVTTGRSRRDERE